MKFLTTCDIFMNKCSGTLNYEINFYFKAFQDILSTGSGASILFTRFTNLGDTSSSSISKLILYPSLLK